MKLLTFLILLAVSAVTATTPIPSTLDLSSETESGEAGPASTDQIDGTLIEHPSEPIVETTGLVDSSDPRISELVEQSQSEIASQIEQPNQSAAADLPRLGTNTASSGGGISVVFNSSSPSPAAVQTVIQAAVSQWDQALVTTPGGPVEIEVFWASLGSTSLLGYAGPDGMFSGSSLPTSDRYPAALTNALLGIDANGSARPEVQVVLNSDLATSGRWHISTNGTPAAGQLDLFTVALHEIGHGLGFLGSAESDDTGHVSLASTPFSFDQQAFYQGAAIPSLADPESALTSQNVRIEVSDAETFRLFAPSNWQDGSSYSHFDETAYFQGQPGSLMTPTLRSTEVVRTLDAATLGVMQQIGWSVAPRAVTPTITGSSTTDSSATISWSRNLHATGLPPSSFRVEALRNGTTVDKTSIVTGTSSGATVTGLLSGTNYTMRVTPIGANGNGTAASRSVTLTGSVPTTNSSTSTTAPTSAPSTTTQQTTTTKPTTSTTTKPASNPPAENLADVRYVALDGQISRLYQAYFLRPPDQEGFKYWQRQRAEGVPLEYISNAFSTSPEFVEQYGSLTDAQFVSLVYANVLGRNPDAKGMAYWQQALAGGESRGSVMIGFAESTEFVARTATAASYSTTEGSIRRLYQAFFLRNPDASGLAYWVGQANSGRSLANIADEFSTSSEFLSRYGSLTNGSFVSLIYGNVLDRQADSSGLNFWFNQLNGGQSRGAVMVGFSESSEFILKTGTIP